MCGCCVEAVRFFQNKWETKPFLFSNFFDLLLPVHVFASAVHPFLATMDSDWVLLPSTSEANTANAPPRFRVPLTLARGNRYPALSHNEEQSEPALHVDLRRAAVERSLAVALQQQAEHRARALEGDELATMVGLRSERREHTRLRRKRLGDQLGGKSYAKGGARPKHKAHHPRPKGSFATRDFRRVAKSGRSS